MMKIRLNDPQKPNQPQEVEFKLETMLNQACLIGRSANCDLILDSTEVSRMHGRISYKNGHYYFTDLASSCGSRLNGNSAQINQDYRLNKSDIIQIGKFSLIILQLGLEQDITVLESQNNHRGISKNGSLTPCVSPAEYMPVAMVKPSQLQRWEKGELTVRCVGIIDETHDVKTFCFVADPPVLFTYKPGQFVTIELEINGSLLSRCYSISSSPARPHTLDITVKRLPPSPNSGANIPQGLVSNWLHENLTVGSKIKLNGPFGQFTCFAYPSPKLLLISAGSGITPMMSMSRWLFDTIANCDIIFFHSARTPDDIIFRQELELISARHPNFHLVITTTHKQPGQSWLGLTGRLNAAMLQIIAPDFRDRTVYVCGPHAFMANVNQMLASLDFPMKNYHEESFGPKEEKSKLPSNNSSQNTVVFSKSGKQVACNGSQPILQLAEQEKVKIPSSCRAGVCGSCKKRKLQGEVKLDGAPQGWENNVPDDYILTCISYPIGRVVIEA